MRTNRKYDMKVTMINILMVVIFIAIIALSIYLGTLKTEAICDSSLPTWLKYILLR